MDTQIETSTDRDEDRFVYTVAEAGALLGISRAFSQELVARGESPSSASAGGASCPGSPCSPSSNGIGPTTRATPRGESLSMRSSALRCCSVDVHSNVHTKVHSPGQGVVTACTDGSPRRFARAVQAGGAEASDVSDAGP